MSVVSSGFSAPEVFCFLEGSAFAFAFALAFDWGLFLESFPAMDAHTHWLLGRGRLLITEMAAQKKED